MILGVGVCKPFSCGFAIWCHPWLLQPADCRDTHFLVGCSKCVQSCCCHRFFQIQFYILQGMFLPKMIFKWCYIKFLLKNGLKLSRNFSRILHSAPTQHAFAHEVGQSVCVEQTSVGKAHNARLNCWCWPGVVRGFEWWVRSQKKIGLESRPPEFENLHMDQHFIDFDRSTIRRICLHAVKTFDVQPMTAGSFLLCLGASVAPSRSASADLWDGTSVARSGSQCFGGRTTMEKC